MVSLDRALGRGRAIADELAEGRAMKRVGVWERK